MASSESISPLNLFKALSEETRLLTCLLIQQNGELCVCELVEALEEIQPKISRHLAQLRSSGILQDRKSGQWVFYSLHSELPDWAKSIITETEKANTDFYQAAQARLTNMKNRPERSRCC